MRGFVLLAVVALGACATPLPAVVVTGAHAFDVRYDAQQSSVADVDARAQTQCAGAVFVSGETRFDGFAYRTYRCEGN